MGKFLGTEVLERIIGEISSTLGAALTRDVLYSLQPPKCE